MMIGQPINRVDGPLKVAGRAPYAYEHWDELRDVGEPLYGFIAGATIGKGRIAKIDTARAERSPGVRLVMTHLNAPGQGAPDTSIPSPHSRAKPMLNRPDIDHYGEPVALVVATTFEQARAAANLVDVEYAVEPGRFDFAARQGEAYAPKVVNGGFPTDTAVGDFDAGFDGAAVKVDQTYTTPYYFSQPMEPNACLAVPHGDDLTIYLGAQMLGEARTSLASTLRIDPEKLHLVAPYVGGGFGSKLSVHAETILAALAARQLGEPVKVALTRQQIFHMVGVRPTSSQRVRLGAGRDGRLVALAHEVTMHTNPHAEYAEQSAFTARGLYAAPNRLTRHRLTPLDLLGGEDVRAPGEAPGLLAVESAMDELAYALGMDPIELRIMNEPKLHPEQGIPFSDRHLVECMREGARRFGWERRPAKPASLRDGRWLVGYGMAAAIRSQFQLRTKAKVRMGPDGIAVVLTDMTDIGTGTYTILTQVAADGLELPMDRVRVELGRSDLPPGAGSGGSWGAPNSSVAVHRACEALREKLRTAGGRVPPEGLEAEGEIADMSEDANYQNYSINTYGAHFAEVGVDADTGETRLRRVLGVFAPGRVLNAKTARSQLIGGMTFSLSYGLFEEAVVDTRSGAFVHRDLAEYQVPVHADIPEIDAVLLDGFDDKANVLGVKGLAELGTCGAGAAVANAVFNATGVRVRDFPITLDKVLPGLPLQ
jgi:xanthine dehydrogenase YagR molybdenum-binding subunit